MTESEPHGSETWITPDFEEFDTAAEVTAYAVERDDA